MGERALLNTPDLNAGAHIEHQYFFELLLRQPVPYSYKEYETVLLVVI